VILAFASVLPMLFVPFQAAAAEPVARQAMATP